MIINGRIRIENPQFLCCRIFILIEFTHDKSSMLNIKVVHHCCILGKRCRSNPKSIDSKRQIYFMEIVVSHRPQLVFYSYVIFKLLILFLCHI